MLILISGFVFLTSEPRHLFHYFKKDQLYEFLCSKTGLPQDNNKLKFSFNVFSYRTLLHFLQSTGGMHNSFTLHMSILPDKSLNSISRVIKTAASRIVRSLSFLCSWDSSWKVFTFCAYSLNVVYSSKDTLFFLKFSFLKESLEGFMIYCLLLHVEILMDQVVLILLQSLEYTFYPFEKLLE